MSKQNQKKFKEFEVEDILNHKTILGSVEFQIKWKGFPHSDNTWEPEENLGNASKLLAEYKQKNKLNVEEKETEDQKIQSKKVVVRVNSPCSGNSHSHSHIKPTKEQKQIQKIINQLHKQLKITKMSPSPSVSKKKQSQEKNDSKKVEGKNTNIINNNTKKTDKQKEFEIEEIVQMKNVNEKQQYYVKWKGYPSSENTWEPEENLGHAKDLLQKFKKLQEKQEKSKSLENERAKEKKIKKATNDEEKKQKNTYKVEKILKKLVNAQNQVTYYVQWQNLPKSQCKWETEKFVIKNNKKAVDEFEKQQKEKEQKKVQNNKVKKIWGLKFNADKELEYLIEEDWIPQKKLKKEEISEIKKVQTLFTDYFNNEK